MKCAWTELMGILSPWIRNQLTDEDQKHCREIRLRLGKPPQLVLKSKERSLVGLVGEEDLRRTVNTASQYSPWSASSVAQGYITAPGGHRIGLAGEAVVQHGSMTGIRRVTSLCIRVARDIHGIAGQAGKLEGSILILGPPGSGKTTLLRDMIRSRSEKGMSSVAVIDQRQEIFPKDFQQGSRTDVLCGCSKEQGLEMAIRCLSPATVAIDEITSQEDCAALCAAAWCGVSLLATAHASSLLDLKRRKVYEPLIRDRLFDYAILLRQDQTFTAERIG